MRIVIVGNGTPEKNCSERIDSADAVVRFNRTYNHGSGLVGSKTTFWCVCAHGAPVLDFVKPHGMRMLPLIQTISEFWFGSPADIEIPGTGGMREEGARIRTSYKWPGARCNVPILAYMELRCEMQDAYRSAEGKELGENFVPSTGLVGIHWVLWWPRFREWDVEIVGFNFFGGKHVFHPIQAEQAYVNKMVEEGRLKWLQ